ncbi:MAG: tetratricopeptide repeat protein [Candidatus Heimdallarchaeota archaeon]|nr:tetratricopeptide repeat protein [Candidatus Heimdallarchaeota archaeon]
MTVETIELYIQQGELDMAIQLCKVLGPEQYRYLNTICMNYELMGEYKKCLNLANEVIEESFEQDNLVEYLGALINKAIALVRLFDYVHAEKILLLCNEVVDTFPQEEISAEFKRYQGSLYNVQGLYARYQGEVDEALVHYIKSLNIRRELNESNDIAKCLANISTIYKIKGELGLALEHNLEAMQIFMQSTAPNSDSYIAYCLHDIGITYAMKGDLLLAESFLIRSLNIRQNLANTELYAATLYELIILYIELNNIDKATQYQKLLNDLNSSSSSRIIDLRSRIIKASIIKANNRIIAIANAQKIFEEIAYEDIIDHELTVFVLLSLCELLLYEYRLIPEEIILKEIRKITNTLQQIAKNQKSFSLLSKTYLLLYRVSLIELDLERAKSLLSQAELIAKEHNLERLLEFISNEQKVFLNKLERYNILVESNTGLIETIEQENLKETLDLLKKRRIVDSEQLLSVDDPVFVLLLNIDGVSLYTKNFNNNVIINKNLIGGFLMASDLGISSAIKGTDGSIESIKYGKYNLIFQKFQDITCCYAFVGPSHQAIKRLTAFLDKIKTDEQIWSLLHKKLIRPKRISELILPYIEELF